MRELKFRVWHRQEKKMSKPFTFGNMFGYEGEINAINIEPTDCHDDFFTLVQHDIGARDGAIAWGYPHFSTYNGVDPKIEIMQYTGLKDRNGREAYHKDIIKYRDGTGTSEVGTIEWSNRNASFVVFNGFGSDYIPCGVFEIIGNIYENEDLL